MAAIPQTQNKVADKHGVGVHGFTNGDEQAGEAPTEVDADFFDAIEMELNNFIITAGAEALDPDDHNQAAYAAEYMRQHDKPYFGGNIVYDLRTQSDALLTNKERNFKEYYRTHSFELGAAAASYNLCNFSQDFTGQANITWYVTVVQTDNVANYANITRNCSARKSGGSWTVQTHNQDMLADNPCGATIAPFASGGDLYLRVTLPAAPAGKSYNIFVSGYARIVTV